MNSELTGIGDVTVLLRAGEIKNTYVEEMLDISAASNQPRTAIGIATEKNDYLCLRRQKHDRRSSGTDHCQRS